MYFLTKRAVLGYQRVDVFERSKSGDRECVTPFLRLNPVKKIRTGVREYEKEMEESAGGAY